MASSTDSPKGGPSLGKNLTNGVVVIGLGRFGRSLALELATQGEDVLGIDGDPKVVASLAGRLTHVVEADATDQEAMRQLSVGEFSRVVIGMGNDLESSILSATIALELGAKKVWAKAISHAHARILTRIGVHHVVRPEHDTGKRVAHLVRGEVMLDYIEFDPGYAFARAPARAPCTDARCRDTACARSTASPSSRSSRPVAASTTPPPRPCCAPATRWWSPGRPRRWRRSAT